MKHARFVKVPMIDRFGKNRKVDYPPYLYGLVRALKIKKENEKHSLVLIAGAVGTGKSSLAEGLAGLDCHLNGLQLNMDDFVWSMDNLIGAMDTGDNKYRPIVSDEWIQSGGARGFALTNIGNQLKIGFVTKRFKFNTYYLLVDDIKEFPEKVLGMADALIIINNKGLERGYFKVFTNLINIYYLWNGFKNFNKNWLSPEIKKIMPDSIGRYPDYRGIFLDPEEFDRQKLEQTRQNDNTMDKKDVALGNCIVKFKEMGFNYTQISKLTGYSSDHIGKIFRKTTTTKI